MKKIMVTQSSMPALDEYVDEIKDIWDSHWPVSYTHLGSNGDPIYCGGISKE